MNLQPVTLEGRDVRLEPLTEAHREGLCAVGFAPELWQFVPYQVASVEEMTAYIHTALQEQRDGVSLPFATIERSSGKVVGSTRYMNIVSAHRRVEIGSTWLGGPWQRTALNTEAKYLMLRHAFEGMACIRVELKTDALNLRSRAAIQRIGAQEEGTLRRHMVLWNGRLRDTVYYSVLDSEWPAVKASLESKIRATRPV
ncbi:MAG: GNAT family protein [Acidobacteriota bacterium]